MPIVDFPIIKEAHIISPKMSVKVNSSDYVFEKDSQNKFIMTLENIKSNVFDDLFRIFIIKKIKQEEGIQYYRTPQEGPISFLSINNFCDAIYLEYLTDKKIVFHVFEMKLNPFNQYEKIGIQFLAAKIHCEKLIDIMGLEKYEIKYYVVYSENEVTTAIYNYMHGARTTDPSNNSNNVSPATKQILKKWYSKLVPYKYGRFAGEFAFEPIKLTDNGNYLNGYRKIEGKYNIV